jgi:hypothetical protein
MFGDCDEFTVTVAVEVVFPYCPAQLRVYVVVFEMLLITFEPLVFTVPILLSIEQEVTLEELQERVDEPPEFIEVGFADKLEVGVLDLLLFTVTVVVEITLP